ncbi:potassium channel family protein [Halomicrobium salinisoli]|uniref:potassium channel family protein n=1 Tax=Halomicrobium salinisoli TaxID=2878391 RepID=UPI001CF0663E|nr:NAD-binding protein [Halomicrobium salinisoli]
MDGWQRRTVQYVVGLAGLMLAFAVAYDAGMRYVEGDPNPFLRSMRFVVETFTTTGYGSEAPWETDAMRLFVMIMDLTGVVVIFLALPVLIVPLFEDAISTTVPTSVDDDCEDHVVVCTLTPRGETLIDELDSWGVDHVVVEPDRERAVDRYEDGYRVIHADPQSVDGLRAANVARARAVVADASDQANTSTVLTAKEIDDDVRVVSVVEEPHRATYHELAGADAVLSPRAVLGESLAAKVTTGVTTETGEDVDVGEDVDLAELLVHRGSELAGQTLAESDVGDEPGVNVVGAWVRGEFRSPPDPDTELTGGTVLLVAGREDRLERLRELTLSDVRSVRRGETVVVGHGEVGETVAARLDDADLPYTVLDLTDEPGVDVVGDATEPAAQREAGVPEAQTVVLAIPDDADAEFAILVARDLNPDVEVVARAEATENVRKMYRAGADYVLSLATVSGRMLASTILEGEEVVSPDTQVEIVRTSAGALAGQTLGDADVRARTGCTVIAVERDGAVLTDVGPDLRVRPDDELVVAGTDADVNRFTATFS